MGEATSSRSVGNEENIWYIEQSEIARLRSISMDVLQRAQLLADIFRLNTISMIMHAGSGHIGTSLSSLDIATYLWTTRMQEPNSGHGDFYFSSKGHDAPGLYSILIGMGLLPDSMLFALRRLHGLPGHPDIHTPYIIANTGSLGMGISKARGIAEALKRRGEHGRIYVLTGDGELQEGQIWESLQPTANRKYDNITVIVDHNKIQSDLRVSDTSDLGKLADKFQSFDWYVDRVGGHDMAALSEAVGKAAAVQGRPQVIIADTIKGKGVSFMEQIHADGRYRYHSGAPQYDEYERAVQELLQKIQGYLGSTEKLRVSEMNRPANESADTVPTQRLIMAHSDELVAIGKKHSNVIAMDADLMFDIGLQPYKQSLPDQYFECGIAEQDMVSFAGALARQGYVPVVHSFACFLTQRANEQIYNNMSEDSKVVYIGALAGVLPGMPGHSHQMTRDIAALRGMPGLVMISPATESQARAALRYAVIENKSSTYLRIESVPWPVSFTGGETLALGEGEYLCNGTDVVIIAYGPIMLTEAYEAARQLEKEQISVGVINMPWLNKVNDAWIKKALQHIPHIITTDNHYIDGGQGEMLLAALLRNGIMPRRVLQLGLNQIPMCGQNSEVLHAHGLSRLVIAERVRGIINADA